ncbi:MAG: ABC transporter ATP-binding protein [Micromonosporaceae bacterium]|nr:ABC transporter ATP-binding protein [Micromonosporaceae bacterium]
MYRSNRAIATGGTAPSTDVVSGEPGSAPFLAVTKLSRQFRGVGGVREVSFTAEKGELVTLLGPSGCGKTTTLRCLAGIEVPESGSVRVGDHIVTDIDRGIHLAPENRNVGMVFQSFALWPHMTVFENVAFPLRSRKTPAATIRAKVTGMLELVGLGDLLDRTPAQLSGGQQQRVALARALVYEPELLLLDEPLSNLDAERRESTRRDIRRLQRELGITSVYVTHDQEEAMTLSNRIVVMRDGLAVQSGSPEELLQNPNSRFVASLLGPSNLLDGTVVDALSASSTVTVALRTGGGSVHVPARSVAPVRAGDQVTVLWRPGHLQLHRPSDPGVPDGAVGATLVDVRLGAVMTEYVVDIDGLAVRGFALRDLPMAVGDRVLVSCPLAYSVCLTS